MNENKNISESKSLTEAQQLFVEYRVKGLSQVESARLAGYSSPEAQASRIEKLPQVGRAIQEAIVYKLQTEGVEAAANFLLTTMRNEDAPWSARVDCAKTILNKGPLADRAIQPEQQSTKALAEMSIEELESFIRQAEAAQAQKVEALPLVGSGGEGG
jgi:phage terminase small subunit